MNVTSKMIPVSYNKAKKNLNRAEQEAKRKVNAGGKNYDLSDISSINVKLTKDGTSNRIVEIDGILAVMFDRDSLGVTNLDRRVTTNYNAKAEFFNNFYKFDCGYFNDTNENFICFYVADNE